MAEATNAALWIGQALLALVFVPAGALKALRYPLAREKIPWVKDVPRPLVAVIGTAEVLGGLGVVLPLATGVAPRLTPLAAAGLATVMLLAAGFHARRRETAPAAATVAIAALAASVALGRGLLAGA